MRFTPTASRSWRISGRKGGIVSSPRWKSALTNSPGIARPTEAACEAARTMGTGAGGTRNISGTSPLLDALEAELASLHGKQAGLLFTSGFVSNQAALSTILNSLPNGPGQPWQVFSDARNHASMIAGIKGSRAQCAIFRHNDLA